MITRRTLWCLGFSQLVCWGISYYLIGAFGELMVADLGWSRSLVYGGFSAALLVMGLASPLVGRMVDRFGGRPVMVAGSLLTVTGCLGLAFSHEPVLFYAAWLALGLAMRMTLYDAAFAALARIAGPAAKNAMSQVTLLGGLASTVFWPIGHAIAAGFGWRGAAIAYAGFALLTVPLHLAVPETRHQPGPAAGGAAGAGRSGAGRERLLAGVLYATLITCTAFLASAIAAHAIAILVGLGVAATAAVTIASLRGIAQTSARLIEVLTGSRVHPLDLGVWATAVLPVAFLSGLLSGDFVAAAIAFSLLYGVGNGVITIVRGTLPLVLFDTRTYGTLVGRLLVPSFFSAAAAPLVLALVIERFGHAGALLVAASVAAVAFGAAIVLRIRFRPGRLASAAVGVAPQAR